MLIKRLLKKEITAMRRMFGTLFKVSLCCGVFLMSIFVGTCISHVLFVEQELEDPPQYNFTFEKR